MDRLVAQGQKLGYVTSDQVFAVVDAQDADALDDLVARLNRHGVVIVDSERAGAEIARDRKRRHGVDSQRGDAMSAYLREISALPTLDREAEVRLATEYHAGMAKALCAISDARIFQDRLIKHGGRVLRRAGSVWDIIDRVKFCQERDPEEAEEALKGWIAQVRALRLKEERIRKQMNRRGTSPRKAQALSERLQTVTRELHGLVGQIPLDPGFVQQVAKEMVNLNRRLAEVDETLQRLANTLGVPLEELGNALGSRRRADGASGVGDKTDPRIDELAREYRNAKNRIRRIQKQAMLEQLDPLRAAVRRYREGILQAQRARDALVMSAQKLVLSSARYYGRRLSGSGMEVTDLISAGNIGLIRAVELFDPTRGNRFSTFAGHWVRHTMIRTIHTQSRTVYVPPHIRQQMSKILSVENQLLQRYGRAPTEEEISEASHMEIPRLRHTIQSFGRVSSIDRPLDPSDAGSATYGDVLADDGKTPDEALEGAERRRIVRALAERLEGRERTIVFLRMGWDGEEPKTLAEVGEVFGISRQRVEQLEKRALGRLRRWALAAGLTDHGL